MTLTQCICVFLKLVNGTLLFVMQVKCWSAKLCKEFSQSEVFTSTVNVAFFGEEIIGGTEEECDNSDGHAYVDAYSRSKKVAENFILNANGQASISHEYK